MAFYVGIASQWRKVRACWVSPGGTWKRVKARWVGIGGQWVLKFMDGIVALTPATVRGFCYSPDVPEASVSFNPTGTLLAQYTDQTVLGSVDLPNWFSPTTPTAGASFEIKATVIAGLKDAVQGAPLDQWLSLDQLRQWVVRSSSATLNQTIAATIEVAIRSVGGTDAIAVSQYALSAVMYSTSNPNGSYGKGGGVDRTAAYRLFQQ